MGERSKHRSRIGKSLRQISSSIPARRNWSNLLGIALNVPIRWIVTTVVHFEREPAGPANDPGRLPSAQQFVGKAVRATQEFLSPPQGQIPYKVGIKLVPHIVVR